MFLSLFQVMLDSVRISDSCVTQIVSRRCSWFKVNDNLFGLGWTYIKFKVLHPCNWNWVGSVQKRFNTPNKFSILDKHDSKFLFVKCSWWFSSFHYYFHKVQRLFIWNIGFRVGLSLSLRVIQTRSILFFEISVGSETTILKLTDEFLYLLKIDWRLKFRVVLCRIRISFKNRMVTVWTTL